MPMIPMEPAKEVSMVRPFLVNKLFSDSMNEVPKDMEGLRTFFGASAISLASAACNAKYSSWDSGSESDSSLPSSIRIMRVE